MSTVDFPKLISVNRNLEDSVKICIFFFFLHQKRSVLEKYEFFTINLMGRNWELLVSEHKSFSFTAEMCSFSKVWNIFTKAFL